MTTNRPRAPYQPLKIMQQSPKAKLWGTLTEPVECPAFLLMGLVFVPLLDRLLEIIF